MPQQPRPAAAKGGPSSPFKSPVIAGGAASQGSSSTASSASAVQDVEVLKAQIEVMERRLAGHDVDATIQKHIELLNEYNAVKDGTSKLFDKIAEIESIPSSAVWKRYGLDRDD